MIKIIYKYLYNENKTKKKGGKNSVFLEKKRYI